VNHLEERGTALFKAACERGSEAVVAKWAHGRYNRDGVNTSWLKIKYGSYSQMVGRRELFETRRDARQRRRRDWRKPVLALA